MTRREAFASLEFHAMYATGFKRLSAPERLLCLEFLTRHALSPPADFGAAVNRMFLDLPKPPNKSMIQDLLTAANTISTRTGRPPMFGGPMVRLDTRVPEGLRAHLQTEAAALDRDLSEHVRQVLIEHSKKG